MAYDPDFWQKQGKVYPALSSSIQYTQGHSVKNNWFAQRTLPLLGRGENNLWHRSVTSSAATAKIIAIGSNTDFTRILVITAADYTSVTFVAGNAEVLATGTFTSNSTAAIAATSLAACINASSLYGKISVSDVGDGTLVLTQVKTGKTGNTSITGTYADWLVAGAGTVQSFSGGTGYWSRNISDSNFFDDSVIGKINIPGESCSANLGPNQGVIETRFSYDMVGATLGLTDVDPLSNSPYRDKNYFNAVEYLTNSGTMTWPVVLEDPAAIDILDYNGVIEPLTIRTFVGMSSTFVGDNLDPEPHTIRAGIGGSYAEELYNRFNLMTEYYEIQDSSKNYPFAYVVDWRIYEGFAKVIPDSTYTNNDDIKILPFVEKTINEIVFAEVTDLQLQNYFIYGPVSGSLHGRPTASTKIKSCGYTYENCVIGTDSLAFGGLLK